MPFWPRLFQEQHSKVTHRNSSNFGLHKQSVTLLIIGTESEIDDFELSIVVYQNVLGFQVPMGDVILMHVLDSRNDLLKVNASLILSYSESKRFYLFSLSIWRNSSPPGMYSVTRSKLF